MRIKKKIKDLTIGQTAFRGQCNIINRYASIWLISNRSNKQYLQDSKYPRKIKQQKQKKKKEMTELEGGCPILF